ncbi:MAG: YraN family protein [Treponema sp.]|nr:YraN family protein [Treponema sp.]
MHRNRPTTSLGKDGEDRAVRTLEEAGMGVIARNFRWRKGEVDIIALDGETLVFVEVKAWSTFGMENLAYGISQGKRRRIIETAKYFLSMNRQYYLRAIRFDVVFVDKEAVTHLASAFMETV